MFMNTVSCTAEKFVTVALLSNDTDCQKGKHDDSYHQVSDKDEKFMEDHTNSYEPGISHYHCKRAPHVLYIDPSLTITDMYDAYKKKCGLEDHKVLSLSTYTRKNKSMNISFAKLGHEECEVCIKYDEHSCLYSSIETICACCSSVNQQKKGKMNVCVVENTLKLRRKSALRGKKILNAAKYLQKLFANVVKYTTRWLS